MGPVLPFFKRLGEKGFVAVKAEFKQTQSLLSDPENRHQFLQGGGSISAEGLERLWHSWVPCGRWVTFDTFSVYVDYFIVCMPFLYTFLS